jgi:hypothetical protein
MVEAQTIRVQITQDERPFFEGDVQVHPWHIGNYGGDWTLWLSNVAPEWVDRTASGIRDEQFRSVATNLDSGEQLAAVQFKHTTGAPKDLRIRVTTNAAEAANQLAALRHSPDAMTVRHDGATAK